MRPTVLIAATCALLVPLAGLAQSRKPDVPGVRGGRGGDRIACGVIRR